MEIETVKVWVNGDEMVINLSDYDPSIHSLTPPKKRRAKKDA